VRTLWRYLAARLVERQSRDLGPKRLSSATQSQILIAFYVHPGAVSITAFGVPFTFQSVDLGTAESSIDSFTIQGFRLGAMVPSQAGMLTLPNAFQTFASINPIVPIDDLIISLTSGASFRLQY
jgi:hypothetical protein